MKKNVFVFLVMLLLLCCLGGSLALAEDETQTQLTKGFVKVTTSTMEGWLPLPLEEDYTYPLTQVAQDGTEIVNVIHLMPNGFYMESSNCDNQDCIEEGTVTFDNIADRFLGNAIVCLPHQVMLELYSLEEVMEMIGAEQ